ncbi:MAG: 23S rRNA (uracil(1939)-C(5))-methyltransferase RlmD [Planctomycetaceae bacterium]|nr:23S rRNA (uracil(1939)-C(5))-methyltransferase RlmD [Planctomycetaceae bacterium]
MTEKGHVGSTSDIHHAGKAPPGRDLACGYFESRCCRSCTLLEHAYGATLRRKREVLAQLFPITPLAPFVHCEDTAGSRIRAKLAVSGSLTEPQLGFYDDQQTIVPVTDCPLHHPLINEWAQRLPTIIRNTGLTPYDPKCDRGELKFVVLTCSPTHQQLMIQFVLRSREAIDRIRGLWRRMAEAEKHAVPVLSANIQAVRSSRISGSDEISISEQTRLPIRFGVVELLIGPQSFLQTNHEIAVKLYAAAGQLLEQHGAQNVLDLYCGAGAFSLTACASVRSVTGIDSSRNAIDCAREAAARSHLHHAQFLCRGLDQLTTDELAAENFDTVICNPPRRGLDPASVTLIKTLQPRYLIYSSCNPATLQRDAQILAADYELDWLQPFDMFPYTQHFEVLAKLLRR